MRTSSLIVTVLLALCTHAQWSTDPAMPMVVSTNAGAPENLRAMSDGTGGWLVFWRDKRTDGTKFELFGQHFNAEGESLWEPNGRLVHHEESSSISVFDVIRSGDALYFAINSTAGSFMDSLKVFSTDLEGGPHWDEPVLITYAGAAISVLYVEQLTLIPTSDGVILGWYDVYFGGSSGVNVTRITDTGEVLWPENGYAIPGAAHGPLNILPDGADGAMVNWRMSNGLGIGYKCMRVDSTGTNAWDANVQTNAGGPGFGGGHKALAGPDASMLFAYTGQANKVHLVQVDTTGALVFNPSPIAVCGFESSQGQVSMVHENGITTLIWGDGRPPASNHDVYMQRFDAEGQPLLDPDGVLVMHLNTYIPNTGLVSSLDGGIIATIDGNVAGYSAMRMNADGTPVWAAPVSFCTSSFNPSYEKQLQLADGEGGIVSFWQAFNGALHGARIDANGDLGDHTGIAERSVGTLSIHPNPANDRITLSASTALSRPVVFGADGRLVQVPTVRRDEVLVLDVSALASGAYTVVVDAANGRIAQRFVKH